MQVLNQMWLETSWKCYSGEACRHFNHQTVGGKIWWQDQSIKSFFLRWLLTITQMWNLYRNYVLLWEMTITGTLAVNVIAFSTKYLPLFVQRLFQCCQVPKNNSSCSWDDNTFAWGPLLASLFVSMQSGLWLHPVPDKSQADSCNSLYV